MGRIPLPRYSHRRLLPWAAMGFSVLWGAVLGLALSKNDHELVVYGTVGMALTLVLRARIIANQLASVIQSHFRDVEPGRDLATAD